LQAKTLCVEKERAIKILYHHRIASKDGQYVHIAEIVNALKELGHEIIMVEPDSINKKEFGKSANAVQGVRDNLPGFIHEILEFCYTFYDFIKLRRAIIQHQPDCIYERYNLYLPSGIWAKKYYKLPFILEVNSPLYEERKKNNGISIDSLAQWTESYVWKNADHILPVTQVLAKIIAEQGISDEKMTVIHNGINLVNFPWPPVFSEQIIQKYQLEEKLILGFVGFVREWHRLDRVLDAIAAHPKDKWHLFLVGDGPGRVPLEKHAEHLGITDRLTITGIVSREKMPQYQSVFDLALQPDVTRYASPLKMFEYMALGKAILAPDMDNIKEILTADKDALLFSDEKDFKEKLVELCQSEQLRKQLGDQAKKTTEEKKFFWLENAKRIIDLFKLKT
jgi:glycosyltransferase involved in cell wall biosynthesis